MLDYNPTRYVTISKEGIIGIWSMNFDLMRCIDISSTIEDETIYARRRTKLWVTDAICMPNVNKLAVASTNRDISFFDMSTPTYKALFHLCGMPNVSILIHPLHWSLWFRKFLGSDSNFVLCLNVKHWLSVFLVEIFVSHIIENLEFVRINVNISSSFSFEI